MEYQITWFILWGVLWGVYFMLDGFVIGAGILHHVLGRNDVERRVLINAIGPVWDGNEVWLLTAGGATFAAFPATYASMFSFLYTALLLLLFALIVRGVSYEFRGKEEGQRWRKSWDAAISGTNFVAALLFGVAFGNIFGGFPIDANGYHGSLLYLLNPYGLVTGVLFVLLFTVHGALYVSVKTEAELSARAKHVAERIWPVLIVVAIAFLGMTAVSSRLFDNYLATPVLFAIPGAAVLALVGIGILSAKGKGHAAFASSCATILLVVATGLAGLFPNLIPSKTDPAFSLTIYNSSSSIYTLKVMTVVAFVFVPIVIAYKIWVYRVFRSRVTVDAVMHDKQAY